MTDHRTSLHDDLSWYAAAWFRAYPSHARPGCTVMGGAYVANTAHTTFQESGVQRTPSFLLRVGRANATIQGTTVDFSGVSLADGSVDERPFLCLQERGDAVHDDAETLQRLLGGYGEPGRAWASAIAGAPDRQARFGGTLDTIDSVPPNSPFDDHHLLVDLLRRHFTYDETDQYYRKWTEASPRRFPVGLTAEYTEAATVEFQLDRDHFYCFAVLTRDVADPDGRWPALELIARIVRVEGFDEPEITIVYTAARRETRAVTELCFFHAPEGQVDALAREALGISTEQKFQHFLAATVHNGSTYRLGGRVWDYDHSTWVITDNRYGCVGFATLFLVYWFNYNEDHRPAWNYAVAHGMSYGFDETIAQHDVAYRAANRRESGFDLVANGIRGFREFVVDGREEAVWILRRERARGFSTHWVSIVDTVAGFINDGRLRLTGRRGGRYTFRWDPAIFADFNVVAEASHHVVLYVKRGRGGANDPPGTANTPHTIFRLGADTNSRTGGRTTWREEELTVEVCTAHAAHGERFASGTVRSVTLAPGVERTPQVERWIEALQGSAVTRPGEQDGSGCRSKYVIWKLRNLRPNGRPPAVTGAAASDPLLDRPARRVVSRQNREAFAVPQLLRLTVSAQVDGQWAPVAEGTVTLRSGMQVRVAVESRNIPAGTPLTIRTRSTAGQADADVVEIAAEGDSTTTDFPLATFGPGTVVIQAETFDGQLRIATDPIPMG